jgi:hypothetical protein
MCSERCSVLCQQDTVSDLLPRLLVGDSLGAHHGLSPSQVSVPLRDMLAR